MVCNGWDDEMCWRLSSFDFFRSNLITLFVGESLASLGKRLEYPCVHAPSKVAFSVWCAAHEKILSPYTDNLSRRGTVTF